LRDELSSNMEIKKVNPEEDPIAFKEHSNKEESVSTAETEDDQLKKSLNFKL
jgi:hypothetical protein